MGNGPRNRHRHCLAQILRGLIAHLEPQGEPNGSPFFVWRNALFDHEHYRFGSASWADETDLRRAGLFGGKGLPIGYFGNNPLHLDGDAPMLTIGGAGSGKLRDLLAYLFCICGYLRFFVLDPRGELFATSWHNFIRFGAYLYCWNPTGLHGNPSDRVNPLDILVFGSMTFHSDAKFIAEGLIPFSGGASSRYFEQRARQWLEALMKSLVEQHGHVDFPTLYRVINLIESDRQAWADVIEAMLASTMEDVRRTASEMLIKQDDTPKEFSAIIGTLYANLSFLDDPALLRSLEHPDMSLADLSTSNRPTSIFLNVPIEYVSLWSPVLRVMFIVTMLYKSRHPSAPRLTMITDEAGQLGNFEALLRSFTFGRGAGVRSWAIFQDIGQIERNFGHGAVQGFMGSAQMRQFFGVRDFETAQLISRMLGNETLEYDDALRQSEARLRKRQAAMDFLNGGDPFASGFSYDHFDFASQDRTKAPRPLMTPDESLALPEDRQILFISGKNLKPVLAHKYPYFSRREMAGFYLPNPYHPPLDKVRIATRWGEKWARVISEPIPPGLAHYPQYQDGTIHYVEGHRPF